MRTLIWTILILASLSVGTAYALDVSGVLYQADVDIINLGITRTNDRSAQEISGANLIDDGFVSVSFLNGVINEGTSLIPSMPPNNIILDEGAVLDDGGSFTEYTTQMRSTAELDVALLPLVPAVNDAFYVGCDNPCRILTFDIGQEGIGGWEIDWQYWNGTAFTTASNVVDGTNDFRLAGVRSVSWDMPTDFATTTVTGSSITSFWVRGAVTSVTGSATQQAIGNIGHYENGQYWMWVESLAINQQAKYQMSLGGAALITHHQIFPGVLGITTADDTTLELGSTFAFDIGGRFDFTTPGTGSSIMQKGTDLFLYPSTTTALSAQVGSTTITLNEFTAADTVSEFRALLTSDGTVLSLTVPGVGTINAAAVAIPDNSSIWEWGADSSTVYFDRIRAYAPSFQTWDTQANWDLGTLTDVTSFAGPAVIAQTQNIDFRVHFNEDDARWSTPSTFAFSGTSADVGEIGGETFNVFFRIIEMPYTNGQTIPAVGMSLDCNHADSSTAAFIFSAIDADNAAAPTTYAAAETPAGGRTSATVTWAPPDCISSSTNLTTPDLSPIFQEIVDRPGWALGNAIVIYLEDNGSAAGIHRRFSFNNTTCPTNCGSPWNPLQIPLAVPQVQEEPFAEVADTTHEQIADADTGYWCESESSFFTNQLNFGNFSGVRYNCNVFMRFQNVEVAQGTTIQQAHVDYLHDIAQLQHRGDVSAVISAIDEDNAAAPTTFAGAEAASRTSAVVTWRLPPGLSGSERKPNTPDLRAVIQEIIDRPLWVSGNSIVIMVDHTIPSTLELSKNHRRLFEDNDEVDNLNGPILVIIPETATALASVDYVQTSNVDAAPPSWTSPSATTETGVDKSISKFLDTSFTLRIPCCNTSREITQNVAAAPGQVWSISINNVCDHEASSVGGTLYLEWLDASLIEISQVTQSLCPGAGAQWRLNSIDGETAPASTAFLRFAVRDGSDAFNYQQLHLDGAIACICGAAPAFPDSSNVLLNPSFERFYELTGEWESQQFSFATVTDVSNSAVIWSATTPVTGSLVVQTTIDNELTWQTVTNSGDSIPLVNAGDDISSTNIKVRFQFQSDAVQEHAVAVGFLQVYAVGDDVLDYHLNTTPGVTILDRSGTGNDGTMSYPVQPTGLLSSMAAMQSQRLTVSQIAAVGIPDAASPVTGSATDNNLFGNDPGSFLPFGQLFSAAAADGGLPVRFIWIILIMTLGIMLGAFALKVFKSTLMASVILGLVLLVAAWIGDGIIPGWSVVVGVLLLTALNLLRPRLPI